MSDKGYESEAAAELDSNECELTLDIIDKIALRLMVAMLPRDGYVKADGRENGISIPRDAYDAANDFLKEKIKRDEFEVEIDQGIDWDGDDEESDVVLVECYGCNEQFAWEDVSKSIGQRYYCKACLPEEEDDEDEKLDREPVAVVQERDGGHFLVIAGIVTIGTNMNQRCLDSEFQRRTSNRYWTKGMLEQVAERFNKVL